MSVTVPTPANGAVEFSQWTFLSTPLDELCELFDARLVTIPGLSMGYQAGVLRIDGRLFVVLPDDENHNRLQCETAARAALADWFDVDITDWPMAFKFYQCLDGETWHAGVRTGGKSS